jgi:hypothetical protein
MRHLAEGNRLPGWSRPQTQAAEFSQDADKVRQPVMFMWSVRSVWSVSFIWFVWFVLFIWLNQTNRINQMNQTN